MPYLMTYERFAVVSLDMILRSVFLILACAALNSPVYGDVTDGGFSQGTFGVGLNFPGLGLRYFFSDHYSGEIRGQFEKDVFVVGPRVSRHFAPVTQVLPYVGVEADFVSFKGDISRGTGYALAVFAGGEYFIWPKQVTVQLDFGPALIGLSDNDYDVSVSRVEFVVNFGINYYF